METPSSNPCAGSRQPQEAAASSAHRGSRSAQLPNASRPCTSSSSVPAARCARSGAVSSPRTWHAAGCSAAAATRTQRGVEGMATPSRYAVTCS